MKRNLITIIFLLTGSIAIGQIKKVIDIPVNTKGDTTYCYKKCHDLHGKLKIKDLMYSTSTMHFRYWQDGQTVDLWTNDNKTYQGLVTDYIWEYKPTTIPKKKNKQPKTYTLQSRIDTAMAHKAFVLIAKDSILHIPSEEKIKGWHDGLDGTTYMIEISSATAYSFRNYWTPTAQKDLKEAKMVEKFVEDFNTALRLSEYNRKFLATLPGGSYSDGGIWQLYIPEKTATNYYYDNDLEEEDREMFQ